MCNNNALTQLLLHGQEKFYNSTCFYISQNIDSLSLELGGGFTSFKIRMQKVKYRKLSLRPKEKISQASNAIILSATERRSNSLLVAEEVQHNNTVNIYL